MLVLVRWMLPRDLERLTRSCSDVHGCESVTHFFSSASLLIFPGTKKSNCFIAALTSIRYLTVKVKLCGWNVRNSELIIFASPV